MLLLKLGKIELLAMVTDACIKSLVLQNEKYYSNINKNVYSFRCLKEAIYN